MKKIIIAILFLFGTGLSAQWSDSSRIWVNNTSGNYEEVNEFVDSLNAVLANSRYSKAMLFTYHEIGYNGRWGDVVIDFFGVSSSHAIALSTELYFVNEEGRWLKLSKLINLFYWDQRAIPLGTLSEALLLTLDKFQENCRRTMNGAY